MYRLDFELFYFMNFRACILSAVKALFFFFFFFFLRGGGGGGRGEKLSTI